MTEGPLFWYLNRATGLVLLVLMTLSVVLGVLATSGRAGRGVPRFVSQSLHRNLSLLSVLALLAHVTTAVVDEYVDIRWWQALVPVGATYRPLWLGLGTVSLDLLAVVVLTSVLRTRLSHRSWRLVHLSSWLAFAAAVAHSVGIGTDLSSPDALGVVPALVCVTAVLVALAARLGTVARDSSSPATGRSA
ncbi:ferric reductase-like transmembrane domain-containing protein [Nocardioides sp. J2M5]|uniref:ferric reductase-like transmembrane domain-containing protein n=1 Tax=Nocardioides palaemonis TaxID=2829810 RepID=UPI001BAE4EE2|nr:ferric reductase-like transmembrane domain-containing protein [Nocardioides palaemonis]MBS2938443.1 ferric reductase-like transmembrane domain-containing protein [Nocardioides palaemonis]